MKASTAAALAAISVLLLALLLAPAPKPPPAPLVGCWYSVFWHLPERPEWPYNHWAEWVRLTPLLGHYDSGDWGILEQHFEWLEWAGVDFIILDHTNGVWNDRGLIEENVRAVFDYADQRGTVKACIALGFHGWDALRREVEHVWSRYAGRPAYFRWRGKPLLVIYAQTPLDWSDERFTVRWASGHAEDIAQLLPIGTSPWGWLFQLAGRPEVVGVCPGWNATHLSGYHPGTPIPREKGLRYMRLWLRALREKPLLVVITSWDDWAEETAIAPCWDWKDYDGNPAPFWYLEITRAYIAMLKRLPLPEGYYRHEGAQQILRYDGESWSPAPTPPRGRPVVLLP